MLNSWKLLLPWNWFSGPDVPEEPKKEKEKGEACMSELLRRFEIMQKIDEDSLLLLANKLQVDHRSSKETLCYRGDDDSREYFLVSGEVNLEAADGSRFSIVGDTPQAKIALSYLVRPRQYTVTTVTACEFLILDREMLKALLAASAGDEGYIVTELPAMDSEEAIRLLASFNDDLRNNKFRLTSIPQAALRIRKMLSDPEINVKTVADMIARTDPAISAKILRSSNSAFYFGETQCNTVASAIVRMGIPTTRQLVLSFTVRDLFVTKAPELRQAMRTAWDHSVTVAAISSVIARKTGITTPDEAMIAGLLSNIGMLSVVNFLSGHPDIYKNPQNIEASIHELKAEVGAMVLQQWTFPEEVVLCATHCEDWERENSGNADLCDLVLVAAIHALIGKRHIPRINTVPAFRRVFKGQANPETAIHFLRDAKHQIDEIRAMLTME